MLEKKFVSLSFSAHKVQIVQLSPNKKKVLKFVSVDLPEKLVVDHKVQDTDTLSQILSNAWKKLSIKERTVGLVVPEFSTFIKILDLPNLEAADLDEAVRWQAYDFLPEKTKEMSMDWRISGRSEDGAQIVAVAIEKEVLIGYVESVTKAGLFPLVVETPSMSLARIPTEVKERLLVYAHPEETIITIADKDKIVASSVVLGGDEKEIASTASRMLMHYDKTLVKQIHLAGSASDNLAELLSKISDISVSPLVLQISGLNPTQTQEFLIPLSLQFKEPSEPSDVETINLLPQDMVEVYKKKRFNFQIWGMLMVVTLVLWSSFIAGAGTYFFIFQEAGKLQAETSNQLSVASKTQEARNKIKSINDNSSRIIKINEVTNYPGPVFNKIESARPEGVTITKYKMDLDAGEIILEGIALTRGDLILFKENLEKEDDFSHFLIPIASFESERDVEFDISFLYKFKDVPVQNTRQAPKVLP